MITKNFKRVKIKFTGAPAKRAGEKARAGREFLFPEPLFLPAPPECKNSKFSIGILFKISSDFIQKVPPVFSFGVLGRYCLALASLGLGKSNDFIRIFEIKKQFLSEQTEICRAKHGQNEILQINLFSFAEGERQNDNLILNTQ